MYLQNNQTWNFPLILTTKFITRLLNKRIDVTLNIKSSYRNWLNSWAQLSVNPVVLMLSISNIMLTFFGDSRTPASPPKLSKTYSFTFLPNFYWMIFLFQKENDLLACWNHLHSQCECPMWSHVSHVNLHTVEQNKMVGITKIQHNHNSQPEIKAAL